MEPLLVANNLVKTYGHGKQVVHAVQQVSFNIQKGECLGLVGESGSGKSSLARLLLALEKPEHGDIRLLGSSMVEIKKSTLRKMRQHIQVVFQDSNASLNDGFLSGVLYWSLWTIFQRLNLLFWWMSGGTDVQHRQGCWRWWDWDRNMIVTPMN